MRPWRRRRPAGHAQVPNPSPIILSATRTPTLVRLGVDGGVLDAPWGLPVVSVAHVWPDPRQPGGWARVSWPADPAVRRFIAPVDLQIGHILEVTAVGGNRHFGWIADTNALRFVLAPAPDASTALAAARRAVDLWHEAELVAVEAAWLARVERVHRLHDQSD